MPGTRLRGHCVDGFLPMLGTGRGTKGERHTGQDSSWGFEREGTQGMEGALGQETGVE